MEKRLTKRLTIELDEKVFYELKKFCVENKTTFKELITDFIEEKINE